MRTPIAAAAATAGPGEGLAKTFADPLAAKSGVGGGSASPAAAAATA
jgi:hypothetical protein